MLKVVDLFAGTGAFTLAFARSDKLNNSKNFGTILANDIEPSSSDIYNLNFPKTQFLLKDITTVNIANEIPAMDLITAGFPCQSFSIAGKQQGFADKRANVFWKLLEIIKHHNPRFVLLENVKNLQSHDSGKTFETIEAELIKLKYHIKYQVLNTMNYTEIPQNRERIYIFCFKNKVDCDKFQFPKDLTTIASKNPLSIPPRLDLNDLVTPSQQIDKKYYYGPHLKIWPTVEKEITKDITTNTIYQYRRFYVRENKNHVCPTLTANMGSGGHNVPLIKDKIGIRKLTPRECFRLQGFPNAYKLPDLSDSKLYKLAGNAVTVSVVELLAKELQKIL